MMGQICNRCGVELIVVGGPPGVSYHPGNEPGGTGAKPCEPKSRRMMREITGKSLRIQVRRTLLVRGSRVYRHKTFLVSLACGHQTEVPFGRRPKLGRKMTCHTCVKEDTR